MFGNLGPENSDFSYLQIPSRGGLTIRSINLVNYVCTTFAILDYSVDVITQFDLPSHTAADRILCHFSPDKYEQFTCSIHESIGRCFCIIFLDKHVNPLVNKYLTHAINYHRNKIILRCSFFEKDLKDPLIQKALREDCNKISKIWLLVRKEMISYGKDCLLN